MNRRKKIIITTLCIIVLFSNGSTQLQDRVESQLVDVNTVSADDASCTCTPLPEVIMPEDNVELECVKIPKPRIKNKQFRTFVVRNTVSTMESTAEENHLEEPSSQESYTENYTGFAALAKPDGIEAINLYLDELSDIELMSRIIFGEQGNNSEESRVLVGLVILNRMKAAGSTIQEIAKSTYKASRVYHTFSCIDGNLFWGEIPSYAVEAANKAMTAFDDGTYVVDDIECINVKSFKSSKDSSTFGDNWYAWSKTIVVTNDVTKNFTCFYE